MSAEGWDGGENGNGEQPGRQGRWIHAQAETRGVWDEDSAPVGPTESLKTTVPLASEGQQGLRRTSLCNICSTKLKTVLSGGV